MPTSREQGAPTRRPAAGTVIRIVPPQRGLLVAYASRALTTVQHFGDSLRSALVAGLRERLHDLLGIRPHFRGGHRPAHRPHSAPGRRPARHRFDNTPPRR